MPQEPPQEQKENSSAKQFELELRKTKALEKIATAFGWIIYILGTITAFLFAIALKL